ncbi:MAG: DUF3368 domain-containing protein [Leptospiraceae bacterium]|nr:DUF3368 domain-containing protein [Leptospiraceae bacterium]
MLIVSDASPLISLALLDKLDLLENLFDKVYVPEEVYRELTQKDKPYSDKFTTYLDGKVKKVKDLTSVNILKNDIDAGEAEAIVLAIEEGIKDILIDDNKGRTKAKMNGLIPIGIVGILLRAKQKGLISEIKPYLDKLMNNKRRISQQLYDHVIFLASENR